MAVVAQLVRALDCGSRCRGFKSRRSPFFLIVYTKDMSLLLACLLGFVQGITEFFPISSSTHLRWCKERFGMLHEESDILFDLFCHLGTIGALLMHFRRDLFVLFSQGRKELWLFFIALIPLVPGYFLFKPLREQPLLLSHLGWSLLATAAILYVGERFALTKRALDPQEVARLPKQDMRTACWIGMAQALTLIPGISRSAATISSARIAGWNAPRATRFSFLLSIPTILGGCALECAKSLYAGASFLYPWTYYFAGFFAACISGICMIRMAVSILERGRMKFFAAYCFVFGLVLFFL